MIEDIDDTSLSYELFLAENGHHTVWICPSWLQVHELLKETEAAPIWVAFLSGSPSHSVIGLGLTVLSWTRVTAAFGLRSLPRSLRAQSM